MNMNLILLLIFTPVNILTWLRSDNKLSLLFATVGEVLLIIGAIFQLIHCYYK